MASVQHLVARSGLSVAIFNFLIPLALLIRTAKVYVSKKAYYKNRKNYALKTLSSDSILTIPTASDTQHLLPVYTGGLLDQLAIALPGIGSFSLSTMAQR